MAYELFDSKATKIGTPALTIASFKISFNADAGDVLRSVGARYVHVLWDAQACKMAVRPAPKADANSYKLTFPQGKRGATLSAQSFLNHIQWKTKVPQVLPVTWNEKEQLLEASLPKEHMGTRQVQKAVRSTK